MLNQKDVEEIASEHGLDVRPIQTYHYRLMDQFGKYILDIYFKQKRGVIVRNTTLLWRTKRWGQVNNKQELTKLITNR